MKYAPMLAGEISPSMLVNYAPMEWVAEPKFDGERALVYFTDGKIKILNREGRDNTFRWKPEISQIPKLEGAYVFDCEMCVLDGRGVSDFGLLQKRSHKQNAFDIELASKKYPSIFYVFDILVFKGVDVCNQKLCDRRQLLAGIFNGGVSNPVFKLANHMSNLLQAYEQAELEGWEGIMIKRFDSAYENGKRSKAWLKVKCRRLTELVVSDFEEDGNGFTALLDNDGTRHRVGVNGVSDRNLIKQNLKAGVEVHMLVEFQERTSTGHLRQPTCKKVW